MDKKDETAAINALIAWFQSQEISPVDSVTILAKTITVAVYSHVSNTLDQNDKPAMEAHIRDGLKIASEMVINGLGGFR